MKLLHTPRLAGVGVVLSIWLLAGTPVHVRAPQQAGRSQAPRPLARFHHIHMNAVDPDASIRFYSTRLKSQAATFAGRNALRTGKGWILFDKVAEAVPNGTTASFWHIGWGSPDIKGLYDQLVKMGTPFATPLTPMKQIKDPRQSHYMYVAGPGTEWVEVFPETGSGDDFEHVHSRAVDPDATIAWYVKHFGFPEPAPLPDVESAIPPPLWIDRIAFRWNRLGSATSFETSRGRIFDHFAFAVDNLDQTVARLQKEGVTVVEKPHAIYGGQLKSAFVQAPDNLQVELVEEKK